MEVQIPSSLEDVETLAAELLILGTSPGEAGSERPSIARDLSRVLFRRFCITEDMEHLEEATAQAREAVNWAVQHHSYTQESSLNLANLCCRWCRRMKETEESPLESLPLEMQSQALVELSTAIKRLSLAPEHVPDDHHELPGLQNYLARMIYDRARPTRDAQDFKDAVSLAKSALQSVFQSTPQPNDTPAFFFQTYRKILAYSHIHLGGLTEDEAIALSYQQTDTDCRQHSPKAFPLRRSMEMLDRGDRLFYKKYFSDAGEFADLVQAIVIYEDAIGEHDLSDGTRRAWRFGRLSKCFCMRCLAKCAIEDLRKALKFGKGARRLVPRDDPDRGDTLRELAEVHRYPYLCTGRIGSLHEVVETLEDALRSLALMLHERFKVHNNEDDIRAAEGRIAQAIELASGDQNRLKAFLKTYADILKAVLRVQKAIESKDLCAGDPMNFHQACSLVGVLYKLKFARSQRDEHFNDALVYLRLARESAPVGTVTMGDLYNQTGKAELLEEAIASARQAILSVPERHYSIYEMRTNLGALLLDRCKSGGKADHAESGDAGIEASRLADLNEAIGYFEQSLEAVHSTRLAWGPQAFGLSFMLSYRAQLTGETSSLPTAFKLLLMSVENEAESHFDRISMASRALRYIFERQQRNRGVARQTGQSCHRSFALRVQPGAVPRRLTVCNQGRRRILAPSHSNSTTSRKLSRESSTAAG
ncbi:hypothetical protein IWX49DRAFT_636672 [Phyllosticta citricarpa]